MPLTQKRTNFTKQHFGTYYNFAEMPSNIWNDVEKETKEFIQKP